MQKLEKHVCVQQSKTKFCQHDQVSIVRRQGQKKLALDKLKPGLLLPVATFGKALLHPILANCSCDKEKELNSTSSCHVSLAAMLG